MLNKLKQYIRSRRAARKAVSKPCSDGVAIRGYVVVEAVFPDGQRRVLHEGPNLVVTQAETLCAQAIIGATSPEISHIWLGKASPATAPVPSDIALQDPTTQWKPVTQTAVGHTAKFVATWLASEGNGITYTEMGLHVGTYPTGLMFARKIFDGIAKTAAFGLTITWYITFLVRDAGGEWAGISFVGPSTVQQRTLYVATGGEQSIAATFDFNPAAKMLDVYLNGVHLRVDDEYMEASAPLNPPIGGPALNKGINLSFTANPGDKFELLLRTLSA